MKIGLVEVNVLDTLPRVKGRLNYLANLRKEREDKQINSVIEEFNKPRYWGLIKPKQLTQSQAMKILDRRSGLFGWREHYPVEDKLKKILGLCSEALRNDSKTIYLTEEAVGVL